MVQVGYTSEAWATILKNPQDRVAVVSKVASNLGGSVVGGWLTFGEYDTMVILELPDNISAAAFSMAVAAGGACKSLKTTPLLTMDEGIAAAKKSHTSGYTPPKASSKKK
jgi:uncharacterized protein with GYD domain